MFSATNVSAGGNSPAGAQFFTIRCGDQIFLSRCAYSPSPAFRMRGLLGRDGLADDEGIWLNPCNQIHMFFMRFPIDAIFLDSDYRIVHVAHRIAPWRVSRLVFRARSVVESAAGRASACGLSVGRRLSFISH